MAATGDAVRRVSLAERRKHEGALKTLLRSIYKYKYQYLLLVPTFALLLTFNYYPAVSALYHSFFEWNGANLNAFIGLGNFRIMLGDKILGEAMINVAKLTLGSLAINLTFPLLAALLIFHLRNERAGYLYRVLYVIPMVVPGLVVLMIWRFFYSPIKGLLNELLKVIGMASMARPWLGDFKLTLYAILFVGFPWIAGYATLIYIAGFQNIPLEILEAAGVDGATGLARVWRIELPLVLAQIKLLVILTLIGSIQGFVNVQVLTNGGPGTTTMVPGLYLYRNAMQYSRMGYACAIGTVLFIIILGLTYLNMRYLRSGVEYEGG